MKKNLYNLFILFTLIFFISTVVKTYNNRHISVSNIDKNSIYQEVTKMLLSIDTYAMSGTVTYISNEDKTSYKILQYGKIDGTYRIELLDNNDSKITTIYDGKTIYQYNDHIKDVINISTTEDSERSEIFITKFIENYESSKDVSVLVSNINDSNYTILEANIPGNHYYFSSEKLFIDNETLTPTKLIIYDENNLERIIVDFEQFVLNPVLDNKIFSVSVN